MSSILEARNITKHYSKDGITKLVLEDFTLDVEEGEILTILGSSGCGKTTALNMLGGFDGMENGEILLKGERLTAPSFSAVMIFQDNNQLFPWLKLGDNIAMPVRKRYEKMDQSFYDGKISRMLEQVGLSGYGEYYPHELSGGMRQRGALARALASEPDILLMDEPFASVDAITRETLQDLLLEIWREKGITVVFVTHDIEEALYISDRIIIMKKMAGTPFRCVSNKWKGLRKTNGDYFEEKERIKKEITE